MNIPDDIFPRTIPAGIDPDGEIVFDLVYDINSQIQKPVEFINLTFTVNNEHPI